MQNCCSMNIASVMQAERFLAICYTALHLQLTMVYCSLTSLLRGHNNNKKCLVGITGNPTWPAEHSMR